jgi:hypothetical protein
MEKRREYSAADERGLTPMKDKGMGSKAPDGFFGAARCSLFFDIDYCPVSLTARGPEYRSGGPPDLFYRSLVCAYVFTSHGQTT